jgi:hypothetical protein
VVDFDPDLDLPPTTVRSLAALAASVASGEIVLDHSVRRANLVASLTAVTGIKPATVHQIAFRLGHREPVRGKLPADGPAGKQIQDQSDHQHGLASFRLSEHN